MSPETGIPKTIKFLYRKKHRRPPREKRKTGGKNVI
jgi:hypothetical protein